MSIANIGAATRAVGASRPVTDHEVRASSTPPADSGRSPLSVALGATGIAGILGGSAELAAHALRGRGLARTPLLGAMAIVAGSALAAATLGAGRAPTQPLAPGPLPGLVPPTGSTIVTTYVDSTGSPTSRADATGATIVEQGSDGEWLGETIGTFED